MRAALVIAAVAAAATLAGWLSGLLIRRMAHGRYEQALTGLHRATHRPWTLVLVVWALYLTLPLSDLSGAPRRTLHHSLLVALIFSTAWLAVRLAHVAEDVAFHWLPPEASLDRRRRARTQIALMRRLIAAVITVVAIGVVLLTFPHLRTAGKSVLATAGVAGVVVGVAASTTIAHALAGVQVAFADALRVDDVVVIQGEWGRVEEVALTHVVVRLWDQRRLIVPTTYFTGNTFQNWTRHEARVLGEVTLHVDYTAELDELRTHARRLVEDSPLWDRVEWVLQVVDATPATVVVQVLASAADGPSAWDLRCDLREELIKFIRDTHPEWLPRTRGPYQP